MRLSYHLARFIITMTLSLLQGYYILRTPFMLQSMPGRICHVCKEAAYHQAFGFLPI